jgi:hypothetical protein
MAFADENTYSDHALPLRLHLVEQLERPPLPVQEEVLVHHEEAVHPERCSTSHITRTGRPRVEEVDEVALPAEERRRRAEVAAHRAPDRRDDRRGRVATAARRRHAEQAEAERRRDGRMADRRVDRLAEELAEPPDALAPDDDVGVDAGLDAGNRGDVPADDERGPRRVRRTRRHISRTLPTFTMIDEMPITSYSCVVISSTKRSRVGKSSSVHGAPMLAWISIRPHDRWCMRSENGPCPRVTWL